MWVEILCGPDVGAAPHAAPGPSCHLSRASPHWLVPPRAQLPLERGCLCQGEVLRVSLALTEVLSLAGREAAVQSPVLKSGMPAFGHS